MIYLSLTIASVPAAIQSVPRTFANVPAAIQFVPRTFASILAHGLPHTTEFYIQYYAGSGRPPAVPCKTCRSQLFEPV